MSNAPHIPVLLTEVLANLRIVAGGRYIDGTFGAGGYSAALLAAGGDVLAIDCDPSAMARGRELEAKWPGKFKLIEGRFSGMLELADAVGFIPVDGVVLDVGVSSMQLDQANRGFSFREDGPLDMRMSADGPSAADIVNEAPRKVLTRIIGTLGEERMAGRIAGAIERERAKSPITRTKELADIVSQAVPKSGAQRIHPATRTFQALRIFVNRELEELGLALSAAEALLKEGGRLVVVAFHSLEDRIVKRFLAERSKTVQGSRYAPAVEGQPASFSVLTRRPIEPSEDELERNPRSRSARLRAAERTGAPARALDLRAIGVPHLAGVPGPEAFA